MEPLRIGNLELDGRGPWVMGVLNVTPDSFSDGGRFDDPGRAFEQARRMVAEGADLIDVGGESTRPASREVGAEEEASRVVGVIRRIVAELSVPVSIDTRKAAVARAAIEAGASLVNDVSLLRHDPALLGVVASAGVPIVLMHSRGTPADMREHARYLDVVAEVKNELAAALDRAVEAGVERSRIWLDPGIGFAKTAAQSVELLARLDELAALGQPLVVGPSRKSFIGEITGAPVEDRLGGTAAAVAIAVLKGAQIVRVHDVGLMRQAARIAWAARQAQAPARAQHAESTRYESAATRAGGAS